MFRFLAGSGRGVDAPGGRPSAWTVSVAALTSQALNSGTNLVTSVRLAQVLSPAEFGKVSIALVLGYLLVAATRSWAVDPIARLIGRNVETRRTVLPPRFGRSVIAASLVVGTVEAVVCAVIGISSAFTAALVTLSIFATAQDSIRAALLLNHRSVPCLISDAVWLIGQAAVLAVAALIDESTALVAVAAATCGAAIALIPLIVAVRHVHRALHIGAATRERVIWVAEQLLGAGVLPLTTVVLAVSSGYEGSAAFRAALLLMGPVTIMIAGLRQPILGWLSRLVPSQARRSMRRLAFVVALAAGVLAVPILLLPDAVGELLLGRLWPSARALLPAIVAQRVVGSASEVFVATNRAFGTARLALASRAGLVAAVLSCALVFGTYGPNAAAWSIAVTSLVWLVIQDRVAVAEKPDRLVGPLATDPGRALP